MKYYIIAGEASGDLHGANLIKEIKNMDHAASFRFWGGDKMEAVSQTKPVRHISDLAFMGFIEVVYNLRTILANIKLCKNDIESFLPDALILIDYPGFNIRIAKWAKKNNIKVFYYISPQIWAWKTKRIHTIMNSIEAMYTILPFEKGFYKKYNYDVEYVGHPLLDELSKDTKEDESNKKIIALLPGSRKQEISRMLPIMLSISKSYQNYQFIIAAAPSIELQFYTKHTNGFDNVSIEGGNTYGILKKSIAALVTSGTATLETGLLNIPQVVCYKGSKISYIIAKQLVKIKYISLVNLILDKPLLTELIQDDFNLINLKKELDIILSEDGSRFIKEGYSNLHSKLSKDKGASFNVAMDIFKKIRD